MGNIINLNNEWKFHLGDAVNADYMGYNDNAWKDVTLPHDWSVGYPFDTAHSSGSGYLPGGTAWYRKHFNLPEDLCGKTVRLTFGGVYKHARVWINSNYLGSWAYGYSTFTFDISDFIREGENVICVRCEHNETADSRWFTGSGIYRDVEIELCNKHCFDKNGVFVTTKSVDKNNNAIIEIDYSAFEIDGAEFSVLKEKETLSSERADSSVGKTQITVANADLWSPDSPAMYSLVCKAIKDGAVSDEVVIPFGIRTFSFDPDEGFFLNGINMKLKGVCVHHDAGALGAAVPTAVWERRLKKFKESGCNALRTAHNPPSADLLDLCDKLGLLVMDEAFDE